MIWLVLYIATIFLANWLLQTFGILDLGIAVPAGTLAAGLSFTARDLVQDSLGRLWTVGAIVVGAAISALVSPQLALASGVTFLVSEGLDFLVYTPIHRRNWPLAVGASNIAHGRAADGFQPPARTQTLTSPSSWPLGARLWWFF